MSSITFERKFFVKELFQPKDFLNQFDEIEFESFQAFLNAIGSEFFSIDSDYKNNVIINNIDSSSQLKDFNSLLTECEISQDICLHLDKDFLYKNIEDISNMSPFSIRTDFIYDDDYLNNLNQSQYFMKRRSETKIEFLTQINYENYKRIFSYIVEYYTKSFSRFFRLKFDYLSLDEMRLKETREFEFRYKEMKNWEHPSNNVSWDFLTISKSNNIYKPIFISDDLKISLTEQSYNDGEFVFDLSENALNNGESVSKKDLNMIRQYLDLKTINSYFPIQNSKLVNFYHNYLLEGSIDELPLIAFIILGE